MLRPVLLGMWSVAVLAVCAVAGTGMRLGAKDGGRTVVLRTGDTVALSLAENPSTGYSWQVVSSGAPVVQAEGEPTFKPDNKLHGAGGTATYRYKAVGAGTSTLKLVYRRPWEKDATPAATFEVTLVGKK